MPQNPADVTNPGSVNVVTEGFGLGPIDPNLPVKKSPSSNAGPLVQSGSFAPGLGTDKTDQPVTVGPSQNSGQLVQGGTASPTSAVCENTTENTVVNQIYGTGTPKNIFV